MQKEKNGVERPRATRGGPEVRAVWDMNLVASRCFRYCAKWTGGVGRENERLQDGEENQVSMRPDQVDGSSDRGLPGSRMTVVRASFDARGVGEETRFTWGGRFVCRHGLGRRREVRRERVNLVEPAPAMAQVDRLVSYGTP